MDIWTAKYSVMDNECVHIHVRMFSSSSYNITWFLTECSTGFTTLACKLSHRLFTALRVWHCSTFILLVVCLIFHCCLVDVFLQILLGTYSSTMAPGEFIWLPGVLTKVSLLLYLPSETPKYLEWLKLLYRSIARDVTGSARWSALEDDRRRFLWGKCTEAAFATRL